MPQKTKFYFKSYNKSYKKQKFYTQSGSIVRNPKAYAQTGAPMYKTKYSESPDINQKTTIYSLRLENNKKYIGKTTNVSRRMNQHFNGKGSQVTKKFAPISAKIEKVVPGYFSTCEENKTTKRFMTKFGYSNVRGGKWVNSKTLKESCKHNAEDTEESDDTDYTDESGEFDD